MPFKKGVKGGDFGAVEKLIDPALLDLVVINRG